MQNQAVLAAVAAAAEEEENLLVAMEEMAARMDHNNNNNGNAGNNGEDDESDRNDDGETDDEEAAVNRGEEDNVYYPEFLPQRVLALNDPDRMQITAGEHQTALNIKRAVADHPEIDMVSDFLCVELALIDGNGNMEQSLQRLIKLQYFREEYKLLNSAEEGVQIFGDYVELMPAFHLALSYSHEDGHYVMVFDQAKFYMAHLKSEKDNRSWLAGVYYTLIMLNPDFEAMRQGAVLIAETKGYDWRQNLDIKAVSRVWSEIANVYPCRLAKFKYFNCGVSVNVLLSMTKQMMPVWLRPIVETGCLYEERLDALYLIPNLEAANRRMMARVEGNLQTRYQNEQLFKL